MPCLFSESFTVCLISLCLLWALCIWNCTFFWGKFSACSPGWPWTWNPPGTTSQVPGWQEFTAVPGCDVCLATISQNRPCCMWLMSIFFAVCYPATWISSNYITSAIRRCWEGGCFVLFFFLFCFCLFCCCCFLRQALIFPGWLGIYCISEVTLNFWHTPCFCH